MAGADVASDGLGAGDGAGTGGETGAAGERRRHQLAVATLRAASRALAPLSIAVLRRLGAFGGDLAHQLDTRAARTTRANLALVYGNRDDAWRRRLARESLRHTAMTMAEAAALWSWPLPRLAGLVREAHGDELLRQRPPGRGALVLAPHYGNWEFLGYYLNTIAPLAPLYERPRSQVLDRALKRARARLGHRPAPGSVGGLRQLVRALRGGGLAAVLPDQVPVAGAGVVAPFFGHGAYTMALAGKLLARVDAEVVVATARRVPGGFSVRIDSVPAGIRDPDPAVSAAAMNRAAEDAVAAHPEQYQWEYKRYRFPGRPNIYR